MLQKTILIFSFLILSSQSFGQRSIPAATDFESYRPLGEIRGWTFISKDSAIGQLLSTVKQKTTIDDRDGIEISQLMRFDYTIIGTDRKMQVKGSHFVSAQGRYLSDNLEINVNSQVEKLELEREGSRIEGFFTRSGSEVEQSLEFPEEGFAADILFLDQYENFLAQRSLAVGDTIRDSVFVPQTMLVEKVEAYVEHFGLISLYNQVKDSAFVIRFTQPQVMIFYFTPARHLVKVEYLAQQMKAYLDIVRRLPPEMVTAPTFSFERLARQLPHYGVFVLIGAVCLILLAGGEVYKNHLYLFLIGGGASFILAVFTQVPLQSYLAENIYSSKVSAGESPLIWASIPALPAGIIQELIKSVLIFSVFKFFRIGKGNPLLVGGAVGAGFGIAEAIYIISHLPDSPIWSAGLAERGFLILFHSVSGVMLASAILFSSAVKKILTLVIVILVNSLFRYAPVFVQRNMLDPELYYIVIPVIPIILLVYCVGLIKKTRNVFRS